MQAVDNLSLNTNFHDSEVMFTYGLDDNDIVKLKRISGVDEIEGTHTSYEFFNLDDNKYQTVVYELPNKIDNLMEVEGKLPLSDNEIGVEKHFALEHNIKIGDYIEFDENYSKLAAINSLMSFDVENDDYNNVDLKQQYLNNRKFKVTALIVSPKYTAYDEQCYGVSSLNQISINTFMYVNTKAFNEKAYCGYTSVLIKNHSLDNLNTFSNEYKDGIDEFSKNIDEVMNTIAIEKNNAIRKKIDDVNSKADDMITDSKKQIEDAQNKIDDNTNKLNDAKNKLDEGKTKLDDASVELENGKRDLADAKAKFEDSKQLYAQVIAEEEKNADNLAAVVDYLEQKGLFEKLRQLSYSYGGQTLLDIANNLIDNFKAEPEKHKQEVHDYIDGLVDDFTKQINDAEVRISVAESQINAGYDDYSAGIDEYYEGKNEIANAQDEVNKANDDLAKVEDDYELFKQEVNKLEDGKYSSLYRKQNSGLIVYNTLSQMYDKLRFSMAALFVIVGLLVCYSAISRIVNDQSKLIGTKKALGISEKDVTKYYLTYTGVALLIGCLLGVILGYFVVENLFVNVLNQNFANKVSGYYSINQALLICLLEAGLLLLTTYIACKNVLSRNAILLLKGEVDSYAKQRFYEKFKLWNKLSLLSKTIVNNFFNDSRRVIGTLIGIAGCTALIVTAITFNSNFMDSFKYQYDNVFDYKYIISFDNNADAKDNIEKILNSENIVNTDIYRTRVYVLCPDDDYMPNHFYVINNEDSFRKLVNIIPYKQTSATAYKGLWLCSSYANYFSASAGEQVKYIDLLGNEYTTNIDGFFNNYLASSFSFADSETYRKVFNDDGKSNCFLINSDNVNIESLKDKLSNIDGFIALEDFYSSAKSSFDVFEQLSKIMVIVYISLSVVMALLVLLNLLTMFVDEKKTELIVLMINGFYLKDAKRYIYSDTILLTIIGIVFGVLLGTGVGNLSVGAFETSKTIVLKQFSLKACIIGAIGSIVLTFVVSLISLRKIEKFKLTDINKA